MCPTVWPAWIDLSLHAGGIGDAQGNPWIVLHLHATPSGEEVWTTDRRRAPIDRCPAPGTRRRHREVAPLPAQLYHPWFVPASQYDGTVDKKRFRACCPHPWPRLEEEKDPPPGTPHGHMHYSANFIFTKNPPVYSLGLHSRQNEIN
jgi:hypothetical protein